MDLAVDFLTLVACRVLLLGCSIPGPSLNWIRFTVLKSGRLQFSIDRKLKVPIFMFLLGNISIFITTPNAIPCPVRRIMTY